MDVMLSNHRVHGATSLNPGRLNHRVHDDISLNQGRLTLHLGLD